MDGKIGILSLQGAFEKHEAMLKRLGVPTLRVRYEEELKQCIGLILPGGESTTMTHQIQERNLKLPLQEFASHSPLFGTCAGMILMAKEGILSLLDLSVSRNAYGRQCDSFSSFLTMTFTTEPLEAVFIRAPRISAIHSHEVEVLSQLAGEAVLVQQGFHLAAAFHPELTNTIALHEYFIRLCIVTQGERRVRIHSSSTLT